MINIYMINIYMMYTYIYIIFRCLIYNIIFILYMLFYLEISQTIKSTMRHLKSAYISNFIILYGLTMERRKVLKLYTTRSIKKDKKDKK